MTKHIRIGLALGLAGIAASVGGCDSSKPSARDPRLQDQLVRVAQVQPAATSERGFTGLIAARVQSNLTFRVAGKVVERMVDTGQFVHAGQPLMRIDRTDFDNVVAAQQGNAAAAKVFDRVGHALAIALTGLINTLNLPLYLLGGGVCEAWDLFAPTMFRELHGRSYVYRLTQPDVLDPIRFEPQKTYVLGAQLGTSAGLLGACLLPLQKKIAAHRVGEDEFVNQ